MKQEPSVNIGSASNLYIRHLTFHNIGDVENGVPHDYDHVALLSTGSVRVTVEGIDCTFDAPHMILIRKKLEHRFEALAAATQIYQIHAIREVRSDDILDPDQIPYTSNPRLISPKPV